MSTAACSCGSRLRVFLLLILVLVLLSPCTRCAPANLSTLVPPRSALLISIPLPGHIVPLIGLAHALQQRGWSTTIASLDPMASLFPAPPTTSPSPRPAFPSFLPLGDCEPAYSTLPSHLQRSAFELPWLLGALHLHSWGLSLYPCMYAALHSHLSANRSEPLPSVVIADFATPVALDIAEAFHLPVLLNNCNALNFLPFSQLQPMAYLPIVTSGTPMSALRWSSPLLHLQRAILPLFLPVAWLAQQLLVQWRLDGLRVAVGLRPISIESLLAGRLVLVNSVWGVEYPRPVSPLIHLVGPLLDPAVTRAEQRAGLSLEEEGWLSSASSSIYVAFGTIAPLSPAQLTTLYQALSSLTNQSIVWKLSPSHLPHLSHLPQPLNTPPHLHLTPWVSSQLSVLSHPHLSLFISHCGVNSLHESLWFDVPLLCMPVQGDQGDSAQKVVDAGVGSRLRLSTLTVEEVREEVDRMTGEQGQAMRREARRMGAMIRRARGLERATDAVELVADGGAAYLRGADEGLPWWAREGYDVALLYAVGAWWLLSAVLQACKRRRHPKNGTETKRPSSVAEEEVEAVAVQKEAERGSGVSAGLRSRTRPGRTDVS